MFMISRAIPSIRSALQSHGPQDPNQSEANKVKKDLIERSLLFKPNGFFIHLTYFG